MASCTIKIFAQSVQFYSLHPKTTLSMNKIKHSLFRVISGIPSIRDSDRIAHLYEKCAILFAQNTDCQWQGVR